MPGNLGNIDTSNWPAPNYVDPVRRTWLPIYAGILFAVGTLMVATRLWLRAAKRAGSPGLDDVFLIIAFLAGIMFTTGTILLGVKYDADRHIWDVPLSKIEGMTRMLWLNEFSFLVTGGCTKISVLLFYRRMVAGTYSRSWKYAVWAAIGFTTAYTVAFILALIFNCSPTSAYWQSFNPDYKENYHCVDTKVINVLAGVVSAVGDLYSVALPCAMTWTLQLHKKQRLALQVVFCLGLLVVAASGVRTYYLYVVGQDSDTSWMVYNLVVWSQLELQLGLMCTSAPAIRALFRTNTRLSSRLSKDSKKPGNHSENKRESSIPELRRATPQRLDDLDYSSDFDDSSLSQSLRKKNVSVWPSRRSERLDFEMQ